MTVCRFAVGSPNGPRSSSYRVWTARNSADVFIAARSTASIIKVTLHSARAEHGLGQEGHHGYTAEAVEKLRAAGKWTRSSRHLTKWPGRQVGPGLWEQFLLFVPANALRPFAGDRGGLRDVQWVPAPPPGQHAVFTTYVGPPELDHESPTILGRGRLCDGRMLWIVHRNMHRSPADYGGDADGRVRAAVSYSEPELRAPDMRALLFGIVGQTGSWVELAGDMVLRDPR